MEPVAAFILAGGQSSRMGSDKALLAPAPGAPLLLEIARALRELAGEVHVIAPPERYAHLGLPVTADLRPGLGPLAGIETALSLRKAEWNLIVACDMPNLEAALLRPFVRQIFAHDVDCILMVNPAGRPEPLCSLYRHTCLPAVRQALDAGVRRVTEALVNLQVTHYAIDNQGVLENLNTREDWLRHLQNRRG